jgi:hypothetical protein
MPETMRIAPRDFIMGPYLRCPNCSAEQYGVIDVGRNKCTRRCRDCLYSGTVDLPELKKKIVYIDQFAISNLMKLLSPEVKGHERAASEPFWNELFEMLEVVSTHGLRNFRYRYSDEQANAAVKAIDQ